MATHQGHSCTVGAPAPSLQKLQDEPRSHAARAGVVGRHAKRVWLPVRAGTAHRFFSRTSICSSGLPSAGCAVPSTTASLSSCSHSASATHLDTPLLPSPCLGLSRSVPRIQVPLAHMPDLRLTDMSRSVHSMGPDNTPAHYQGSRLACCTSC